MSASGPDFGFVNAIPINNVDYFQGTVKGHFFSRTLIRLFEFFNGRKEKKVWIIFWSSEFVNAIFIELSALFLCG